MHTNIRILILLFSIILSSCQKREWNNPFDPECPKELWTPTDFQAIQVGNTVKLAWSQPVTLITGFKITRKVDNGQGFNWLEQPDGINQFVDENIIGGKLHVYNLIAYAGENESNQITVQLTPVIAIIAPKTVTDIDGNVYNTVAIGTQIWMAENLKTTKYNDGTSIPNVTDNAAWGRLVTGAYCWYNNDAASYKNTYGALYNWYSVNTAKLAPTGWHIPSKEEWEKLTGYLGGLMIAGGKLKEIGTTHWANPNVGATNESGFSAFPGGEINGAPTYAGTFWGLSEAGFWWSNTEEIRPTNAYSFSLNNFLEKTAIDSYQKSRGFSVRCIKD